MWKPLTGVLLAAALLAAPAKAEVLADLELVLAVDGSSSIDIGEYALQLRGIARGFRDPGVKDAIRNGVSGRIAVNVIVWAEQKFPKQTTGWHLIASDAEADAFAALVEALPRRQFGGTGIGEAIDHAVKAILGNGIAAERAVIDVSGDGVETVAGDAILLPAARLIAARHSITVNGLAVLDEDRDLLAYFRTELATGPGAFVISATDYFDFERAMRAKLQREISHGPAVSRRASGGPGTG